MKDQSRRMRQGLQSRVQNIDTRQTRIHSTLSVSTLSHSRTRLSSTHQPALTTQAGDAGANTGYAASQTRSVGSDGSPIGRHSPSCLLTPKLKSHSPSRLPPKSALAKSPGLQASDSRGLGVSIYFPGHPTSDILNSSSADSRQPVFNLKQEEAESNTVAAVAQPISTPASDESGNEIGNTTLPPKGPKQRSKVWEYFEVYVDKEKGEIKGKCKYCQKEYAADTKKNGTSGLNYHVKTCKKIPGNEDKTQSQLSLQPSGDDESTAEKYEKAFERFELEDLYFGVEVDANSKGFVDWDVVRKTITMLWLFYDTTIRVSGSLYVTSNTFWTEISDLLSAILEWTRSDDSNVKGMGTKMKTKFDKYWGNVDRMNKIIFFAVVLDPREKFMAMEVSFCDIYGENEGTGLFERVKMSLYDIFKEYKNILQIESGHSSETSPSSNTSSNESVGNRPRGHYKLIAKKRRIESGHVHAKSELDMYLDEALQEDKDDFDILKWWKLNSERFPILSHMARDILAIPISTVASESTFSAGGRVLDPFRSSLTPKMVESLICAQDWIRKSNGLNVEEDITEVEKFENGSMVAEMTENGWLLGWYLVHCNLYNLFDL
ncbi:zinc finger BED domain-containing protein RICESLEEPER 2-like [Canna indica]|uniref:Zinc finger BED domain-containing protein RICESLEEPER 2-like n=1 Tax=Canna indica TaxID=4628 RepID=A0AAQ3K7Y6_9LILI|nr:zinc finger BED domain-containing protein RICESLEEPER 2-like [Canna indica]